MAKVKVKLVRLESNHNNLRSSVILGECDDLPKVGHVFQMEGPPFDPNGGRRYVTTTPVTESSSLPNVSKIVFKTKNSKYRLEVLG